MNIYFDSTTGNVFRFVSKILIERPNWNIKHVRNLLGSDIEKGHLITHTTGMGNVPRMTQIFLKKHHSKLLSVSSSGNRNWGLNFARSVYIINEEYNIPIFHKFELSGTQEDVNKIIEYFERE